MTGPVLRGSGLGGGVYDAILQQLMYLDIPPGARITVDNLARSLGVSQTPVREALARLEADGLVKRTHLIGYSAAPLLTPRQIEEIYEIRLLLEPHAAKRAAGLADDKALNEIGAVLEKVSQLHGSDSRILQVQFARLDAEFHERIAAASQSSIIRDTLARVNGHTHTFRLMFNTAGRGPAVEEHAEILSALRARDPDRAANAAREHVKHSRTRYMTMLMARASDDLEQVRGVAAATR